jgi:hypothetical protein
MLGRPWHDLPLLLNPGRSGGRLPECVEAGARTMVDENEAATDGFDPSELEPDMSASSSAVRSI